VHHRSKAAVRSAIASASTSAQKAISLRAVQAGFAFMLSIGEL